MPTLTEYSEQFQTVITNLKENGCITLPSGQEITLNQHARNDSCQQLDAAQQVCTLACQFEDETNSVMGDLPRIAAQIEHLEESYGEPVTVFANNTTRHLRHPTIDSTQDLLFAVALYHHLLDFQHVESSRTVLQQGVYPFTSKAINTRKPFVADSAKQLLVKIKQYIATHQDQLHQDLANQSISVINQTFCSLEDKFIELLKRDVQSAVSALRQENALMSFARMNIIHQEIKKQRKIMQKIIQLVGVIEELHQLKTSKNELNEASFLTMINRLKRSGGLSEDAYLKLKASYEHSHKFSLNGSSIYSYTTYALNGIGNFLRAATRYPVIETEDAMLSPLMQTTQRLLKTQVEHLNQQGLNFEPDEFTEKNTHQLKNMTKKLLLLEALTNVKDALGLYKRQHENFITKSARWGLFGLMTKLITKVYVLRVLLNDKVLLLLEADKLATKIEKIKSEVTVSNLDEKKVELDRIYQESTQSAQTTTTQSLYLFFRDDKKRASKNLQDTIEASKATTEDCFATIGT